MDWVLRCKMGVGGQEWPGEGGWGKKWVYGILSAVKILKENLWAQMWNTELFIECQFYYIIIAKLTCSDGMPCANRHLHAALHSCSQQPHGAARGRAGLCIQIFTNLETTLGTSAISVSFAINWQVDTDYYPTLTELTLASKLLQIGRYIFFLIL